MADKDNEQMFAPIEVMACNYCKHYKEVGGHGAIEVCQNGQSPYYDSSIPTSFGTDLTPEQKLRGCDKIDYNGQKIRPELFKVIPKDSNLRKYPLDQIVDGFTNEMDLESEITVEELTKDYEKGLKIFEQRLRKSSEK